MRRLLPAACLLALLSRTPAGADELRGSALYAALGRPDLAERYDENVLLRRIGIGTGGGLVGGGLLLALFDQMAAAGQAVGSAYACAVATTVFVDCQPAARDATLTYVGLASAGAGAVLMLAAALSDPDPLDAVERARLLDEDRCAAQAAARPRLVPIATPGGAGLSLRMAF